MKLSCLPVSLFSNIISGELTIPQWAEEAATLNLNGIDLTRLFFEDLTLSKISELRKNIENYGIKVAVLNTYPNFTHPNKSERAKTYNQIAEDIEKASMLGAEIVRITAGQAHPTITREEGIKLAIEGILITEENTLKSGVTLALENHSKPGVWEYYDFAYKTDVFLEIVEKLKKSSVKVLFDTANTLAYGDDPLSILKKVYKRVVCIHVADIKKRGSFDPVLIGSGVVPFKEIFSFLKESKYSGWISIEEASFTQLEGITLAVKYVREVWDKS